MRGGILAIGLILLVLGVLIYSTGNNLVQEVEAYDVEGIPISKILKLHPDFKQKYDSGQSMIMFGSIFGIVGFILCIAGIAASKRKREICDGCGKELLPANVSYLNVDNMRLKLCYKCFDEKTREGKTMKKETDRRCPDCGRIIPNNAELCPDCGKKFKKYHDGEVINDSKKEGKTLEKPETTEKFPEFCSKCGAKTEEGTTFCVKCGKKLI